MRRPNCAISGSRPSLVRSTDRACFVESLEERHLLSVSAFLDSSTLTPAMVDQYGDALIGENWQSQLGMTTEEVLGRIEERTFQSLIVGDENPFVVSYREKLAKLGRADAQALFDHKLEEAALPKLSLAHSDWFQDLGSPSQEIGSTMMASTPPTPEGPGEIYVTATTPTTVSEGEYVDISFNWDAEEGNGFSLEVYTQDGSALANEDYTPHYYNWLIDGPNFSYTLRLFTHRDGPDFGPSTNPLQTQSESYQLVVGNPVTRPGYDRGEGTPSVVNGTQTITILEATTQETPEDDDCDDECDCSDNRHADSVPANNEIPQPRNPYGTAERAPAFSAVPLDGSLLVRQEIVSGPLAHETALHYRSDIGLNPIITVDTTIPLLPDDDSDKVLLSATAELRPGTAGLPPLGAVQDSRTYTSPGGLQQGQPISFSLQGEYTGPDVDFAPATANWVMSVTYNYDTVPDYTVNYNVQRMITPTNVPNAALGKGWSISGLNFYSGDSSSGVLVFGNGDVAYFLPDGQGGVSSPGIGARLTPPVGGTGIDITFSDGTVEHYGSSGLGFVDYKRDREGNTITYHYGGASGNLYQISDSRGQTVRFNGSTIVTRFDNGHWLPASTLDIDILDGRLHSVTHPDPIFSGPQLATHFTYHAGTERLETITAGDGEATTFNYDGPSGRLTSIQHDDGTSFAVESVVARRVIEADAAGGQFLSASAFPATFTDEMGKSTYITVDTYGSPTSIVDAASGETLFDSTHNEYGNPTEVITPDPRDPSQTLTTTYTYDGGNLTHVLYPDGSSESWTYHPSFPEKMTSYTDRLGRLTVYEVDSVGDTRSERRVVDGTLLMVGPNDVTTSFTYTQPGNPQGLPAGLKLTETDPRNTVTEYAYYDTPSLPSYGKLHTVTYAVGTLDEAMVTYEYNDPQGNLTDMIDELGRRTHYTYDVLGRLFQTDLPDPVNLGQATTDRSTKLRYDVYGNVTKTIDALEHETDSIYEPSYFDQATGTHHPARLTVKQPDPDGEAPFDRPTTIYEYDLAGNVVRIIDPLDRISNFFYNADNRLRASHVPHPVAPTNPSFLGPKTSYTYDVAGRMLTMTDSMGNVTSYEYDINGRQSRTILPDPITTGFAGASIYSNYNAAGELTSTVDAKGYTTSYTYDALGRPWKTFFPDESGNANPLTSVIYTENTYDKNGNLTEFRDAMANVTVYDYDFRNRQTDVYLPHPETGATGLAGGGPHTETVYRKDGSIDHTFDPLLRKTTYGYDFAGRQTGMTFASADGSLSVGTSTGYDDLDRVTSTTDGRGYTTIYVYDDLSRRTDVYLPHPETGASGLAGGGPHTHTKYDAAGQVESVTDPLTHVTSYQYDGMGRLKVLTPPDAQGQPSITSAVVEYVYDANSNLRMETTYVGFTPLVTQYLYDKLNRQTQVILPNGDTTTYGYDDNNNRTSLLDDAGNLTVFAYDTRNRLETETNQLAAARTYTYDHNGNRLTATDRNGRLREFDYDYLNRLTDEKWLDTGAAVVYTNTLSYNADGTLASNVDVAGPAGTGAPISAYTYLYDGLGRLTSVDNLGTDVPWHVVLASFDSTTGESFYDANGNRTRLRATIDGVADFENVYEYDKINRPDTIIQRSHGGHAVAPKRADFIYDAASRLQNINTYAAVTTTAMVNSTTYTVDPSGRLTYLSHFQPGTSNTILYGWGYDRSNRVTSYSRNDTGGLSESQTYNYDDAGQLTGSTGTLPNENYTYDANGNRTNTGYSTPAGSDNRLATDGTYSYAYDAEGNLILRTEVATPGNARVFEYDYRNRLVAVRDYTGYVDALNPGTLVMEAEYTYDVNNLRIKKVVDADGAGPASAVTTGFVYDQGHVVLQFDGTAGMTNRYLYGPAVDQVLADERASGVLWALADNLGSVRDLVDSGGTPVNHVKYSAFGEKVFELAPATNFLFGYTGAVFDVETNLGYHRARYLDHATGRWINQDPIGFTAGDANLYRYVDNEPTNAVDPTGEIKWRGSATFTFWAILLGTKPYLSFTATAEDSRFTYTITYEGYLTDSNVPAASGVVGLGYFSFTSRFTNVEAPAQWPMAAGSMARVTTLGPVQGNAGELPIPLGVQRYEVGAIKWTDFATHGGVNGATFGGAGKGWLDGAILKRTKARKEDCDE